MIETIFIGLIAILPVAILFEFIYISDHYKKEPLKWLLAAFILGIIAAGVTDFAGFPTYGSGLFDNKPLNFIDCLRNGFLLQAIPSELAKFVMLFLLLHINKHYDEHVDSIVYSCCIALGFIGINNAYYLFNTENWLSYGNVHGLVLIPFHFGYGALLGYLYGYSTFSESNKWATWIQALVFTIIIDGLSSTVLMSFDLTFDKISLFPLYVVLVYVLLFWITRWGISHMLEEDKDDMESQ